MTDARKVDAERVDGRQVDRAEPRAEGGPRAAEDMTVDSRSRREQLEQDRTAPSPADTQPTEQFPLPDSSRDQGQVEAEPSADTSRGPLAAPGATGAPDGVTAGESAGPARRDAGLIAANDVDRYRNDWRSVQSGFVDDPAGAVREADALVGRLFDTITSRISQQRSVLSAQRPDDSADRTEQLRLALRDYRTMFEQLLPSQRG